MPSQGAYGPSSVANSGFGVSWVSPNNVQSEDGASASAVSTVFFVDQNTKYLQSTQFGFTIPSAARIDGIYAGIKKYTDTADGHYDFNVQLLKAGSAYGSDYAAGFWPTSLSYVYYGGSTDLWGGTWTPSDINNTNFGIRVAAINTWGMGEIAYIDAVILTVYYTILGGGNLPMMGVG